MLNGLKRESPDFAHNYQKIMIMRELQKRFGEIYLGGGGGSTDMFFILESITTNCQMDSNEFEGLLYTMLSEEPFENHRLGMTDENEEYTITDYASQHHYITIGETLTCITSHATKTPKIFKDFAFILPFEEISKEGKKREK